MRLGILFFFMSWSSFALSATQDVTISGVGISESTKTIFIDVSPNIINSPCTNKTQVRISINDSEIHKEVFSAALAALAAKKTVNVGYSDLNTAECLSGAPVIQTFYVRQ
ncbi:hypothetical protein [Microbulbifer sp. TRSA005]|uniref:hypothetical protein n=1 Tax=Microbulbifer sp. TRSA005 TaxID=3243383 RepID=UPI00403A7572